MWVLIVISVAGGSSGQEVHFQEFSSEFKCQTAAQLVRDGSNKRAFIKSMLIDAICVEK